MLLDNSITNVPSANADAVKEALLLLYTSAIKNKTPYEKLATVMLWGPPGVGKSSIVEQACYEIGELTGKEMHFTDIRLYLFSPIDLHGIPVADVEKEVAVWLKPQIFDLDDSDDVVNVLFFDEISSALPTVQGVAYQICQNHRVGEHELPKNTIIIAAGNRTTDHSVAYKMPAALANRMMHLDVTISFDSWKKWAICNGIDERVIGFLSFDNSRLCEEPDKNSTAFPTPRSWAYVSANLKTTGLSVKDSHLYIAGHVGVDTAVAFENWCEIYDKLPNTRDIFNGTCTKRIDTLDAFYAVISSLTAYVSQHSTTITDAELDNAFSYVVSFGRNDFAMMFHENLMYIKGMKLKLMRCPSIKQWISRR